MPSAICMATIILHIPSLVASIILIAIAKDIVGAAMLEITDMIDDLADVVPAVLSILATIIWFYRIRKGIHQRKIEATLWQFLLNCLLNSIHVVAILCKDAASFTFNIFLAVIQIETAVAMPIHIANVTSISRLDPRSGLDSNTSFVGSGLTTQSSEGGSGLGVGEAVLIAVGAAALPFIIWTAIHPCFKNRRSDDDPSQGSRPANHGPNGGRRSSQTLHSNDTQMIPVRRAPARSDDVPGSTRSPSQEPGIGASIDHTNGYPNVKSRASADSRDAQLSNPTSSGSSIDAPANPPPSKQPPKKEQAPQETSPAPALPGRSISKRGEQQDGNLGTPDTSTGDVRTETADAPHMDTTPMLSPGPSARPNSPVLPSHDEVTGQPGNDAQDTYAPESSEHNDLATGCTNNVENAPGPSRPQFESKTASGVTAVIAVADGNGEVVQNAVASEGAHTPPIPENTANTASMAVAAVPNVPVREHTTSIAVEAVQNVLVPENVATVEVQNVPGSDTQATHPTPWSPLS